jgi:transcription antitermination factor NusG
MKKRKKQTKKIKSKTKPKTKVKVKPKAKVRKKATKADKEKNHPGWVALELNSRGETEKDIQSMLDVIRKSLDKPKLDIFVPIYYKSEEFFEKNVPFFDGYFFLKFHPDLPYSKLTETKFFQGAVVNPTTKEVQIISNEDVEKIQKKFQEIIKKKSRYRNGQNIVIIDGLYKGLNGKIKKIFKEEEYCIAQITSLKSRNIEVSVPLVSIDAVEEDQSSSVVTFFVDE